MADITLVKNEGEEYTFQWEQSDGTNKDVTGDTFSLEIYDSGSNFISKSDSDFDKTNASDGEVKFSITTSDTTKTGTFRGEVKRDGGSDDTDIRQFSVRIGESNI